MYCSNIMENISSCLSLGEEICVGRKSLKCFNHFYLNVQQIYKDQWGGDNPVIWQSRWPIPLNLQGNFYSQKFPSWWDGLTYVATPEQFFLQVLSKIMTQSESAAGSVIGTLPRTPWSQGKG